MGEDHHRIRVQEDQGPRKRLSTPYCPGKHSERAVLLLPEPEDLRRRRRSRLSRVLHMTAGETVDPEMRHSHIASRMDASIAEELQTTIIRCKFFVGEAETFALSAMCNITQKR